MDIVDASLAVRRLAHPKLHAQFVDPEIVIDIMVRRALPLRNDAKPAAEEGQL